MKVGDLAVMRKPHACGSFEWDIVRVGAVIGAKCVRCGHKVLLDRAYFTKNAKKIIPRGE